MRTAAVDAFMAGLDHPRRAEIDRLRLAILDGDPALAEGVKWNAPSFTYEGQDRVTFRVRPGDHFDVIFHRGAKPGETVTFEDPTGRLTWKGPDRALLAVPDPLTDEVVADVVALARAWARI